jgi:cell division septation protein DedD
MADEGVHEIQLNGKQLVFMFMAVTVVAVVIFLCGVMVGRGVRAPRLADAPEPTVESSDPTASVQSPAPSVPTDTTPGSSNAASGAPISAQEKLTYADRLSAQTTPPETLREPIASAAPAAPPAAPERAIVEPPPPVKRPAAPPKVDAKPAAKVTPVAEASAGSGNGFVVQVAAVRGRSEADTIAKRLASKGFPSYVTTPGPGAAGVYRVRVGKFADRRQAESVAKRLEKEEQFKPWITR